MSLDVERIYTIQSLLDFIDAAEADPYVATDILYLTIVLAQPAPVEALQRCLSMTVNVVDLILFLPSDTPAHLLVNVSFPRLELLKTNLPHGHLLPFLNLRSLSVLCLGSCGRHALERVCPLTGADLSNVVTLECPAGCASSVSRKALIRLTVDDRPSAVGIPQALRSLSSSSLLYLSLDFFLDDYDVLQSLVTAVPYLRKLKLLEKHRSTRRQSHARRAWNDVASWSRALLKLSYLEEVALRTAAAFVPVPACVTSEEKTLIKWVSGTQRKTTHRPRHPTLNHIRIWYRCRDANNGVVTHWSRYFGKWQNTLSMCGPHIDTLF